MARGPRKTSQKVTIETVAAAAGVSSMTVSNVLNGSKPVREATREAVMRAVRELNYTPNLAAKSLASAEAIRIGLIISRADHSFHASFLLGTVEATSRLGAQLMLRRLADAQPATIIAEIETLAASGANAVVLPGLYAGVLASAGALGRLPVPVVAASPGQTLEGIPNVRIDDTLAAREMTQHLIALGHRRIGFVRAMPDHLVHHTRHAGYRAALEDAGIAYDPALVVVAHMSFQGGMVVAGDLLDAQDRPTAIFASNDDIAAAIVAMAHKRGIRVPAQLSVAGFDNSPLAQRMWPSLTTIDQPVAAIADKATQIAVHIARHPETAADHAICFLPHRLILRESAQEPPTPL
ncbi:MAG TPA: LacI family DNA-binding transcriptional regulator [Novosphingobium sp.]|nr:LacI family DNA-binding transcriptional regulator [Novosphingobium sp.]